MPGPRIQPLRIPADFWHRDDVTAALTARDFKALFTLLRKYAGASQTLIGSAVQLTQSAISQIMAGHRIVTTLALIERIAEGLHMPDHARLAFGLQTAPAPPPAIPQPVSPAARTAYGAQWTTMLDDAYWNDPETLTTLAARDIAQLFRTVQRLTKASQTQIGVAIGITQGEVSDIMNARRHRRILSADLLGRIAAGLAMPDHAAATLVLGRIIQPPTPPPAPAPTPPPPQPPTHTHPGGKADTRPNSQQRRRRNHSLRARGLTWDQIAAVWLTDYPHITPRVAYRWTHDLTHQDVAEHHNADDPGQPTMSKARIYEYETWPANGRRPTPHTLDTLARLYQTTARHLLTDDEHASYDPTARDLIDAIDHSHHDTNRTPTATNPADDHEDQDDTDESTMDTPGMSFGPTMRILRRAAGLSTRALAAKTNYSNATISHAETGRRTPTKDFAATLDNALNANGQLIETAAADRTTAREHAAASRALAARVDVSPGPSQPPTALITPRLLAHTPPHETIEVASDAMRRRSFLSSALAALMASSEPAAAALEAVRSEVSASVLGHDLAEPSDYWSGVAREYAHTYLTTPPADLVAELAADILAWQHTIEARDAPPPDQELIRAGAQLAAIMAMTLINLGRPQPARRWWRTARHVADASADPFTRVWVRGEQAIRSLYANHSPQVTIDLADEALAIGGGTYAVKPLASKAQALALLGRSDEARATVVTIESALERSPASITNDDQSIFGWPEHCLRHAESYVYSHIGDTKAAGRAQQSALSLYPATERRAKALVQLHQAMCDIHSGHINDGTHRAVLAIESLPPRHRTAMVQTVGLKIIDAIPLRERERSSVAGLADMLALPSGTSTNAN